MNQKKTQKARRNAVPKKREAHTEPSQVEAGVASLVFGRGAKFRKAEHVQADMRCGMLVILFRR